MYLRYSPYVDGRAQVSRDYLTRPSGHNDGAIVKNRFTTADKSLEGDNTVLMPGQQGEEEGDERENISESIKQNDTDTKTNRPFSCIGIKLPIKQSQGTLG